MESTVGIDLTAGGRPTAVAILTDDIGRHELAVLDTDEDILAFVGERKLAIVAIDAPLGLPLGQCCLEETCACLPNGSGRGREAERALARLGIGCFYTTKRSIIKPMVYRAIGLRSKLQDSGCTVLEVYPYATKVRLFGKRLPRKSTVAGQAFIATSLGRLLGRDVGRLGHDSADALLCAYTGWLFGRGLTEALGSIGEGQIHIPAPGTAPFVAGMK